MVAQRAMGPGQVVVERGGGGVGGGVGGGLVAGLGAQHRQAQRQRVAVGDAERRRAGDEQDAVAVAAVAVAKADLAAGVVGDGLGEGGAGLLAIGDEALPQSQPGALDVRAREAGREHDVAGGQVVAARAGDQRSAVGELILGVAEQQVQRDGAAQRIAGALGVQRARDALPGEPIEVGRAGGLERRLAAQFGRGPIAQPVEDDQQDAQAHVAPASRAAAARPRHPRRPPPKRAPRPPGRARASPRACAGGVAPRSRRSSCRPRASAPRRCTRRRAAGRPWSAPSPRTRARSAPRRPGRRTASARAC